jgi:hypothetical protein
MKVDWPHGNSPLAYAPAAYVNEEGNAVLDVTRTSGVGINPYRMKIVADADGPVHSAFLDPRGEGIQGCTFIPQNIVGARQGSYAMRIIAGDDLHSFPEAIVGGSIDELHPKVQWIWDPSKGHGLAASDQVWVSWNGVELGITRWGEPWQLAWSSAQAGGAGQYQATAWHDFVTWKSGDTYQHIMAWTPTRGAYPLVAFPGDWSRGASAMGTDGQHLVWMEGEGKPGPGEVSYAKASVMAAPFTTGPEKLAPKRLRSIPSGLPPVSPWIVGCGYAATAYTSLHILVVRLSDGWSWELTGPNPEAPPKERRWFNSVLAVTCDELFLEAGVGQAMNIARVRIDALGPGMAPD